MNRFRYTFFFAFLAILLPFAALPESAAARENVRVVRVGFYELDGFQHVSNAGELSGYSYEYLQMLAQYAGWGYEFVTGKSFDECLEMLDKGEIDLLGPMRKNAENLRRFSFPDLASGSNMSLLVTRPESHVAYEDFSAFDGLKVGFLKDVFLTEDFYRYSQKNHFSATMQAADNQEDLFALLDSGAIDVALVNRSQCPTQYRVVARFASRQMYYAVSLHSAPALLQELNNGLLWMKNYTPDYATRLAERYYSMDSGQAPVFTLAELAYIRQTPEVTVYYDPAWKPLEYRDPKTGEYAGVAAGIYREIERLSGLKFRFIAQDSFQDSVQAFLEKKGDIFSVMTYDVDWAVAHHVYVTQPFLEAAPVVVMSPHNDEDTAALAEGYYFSQLVKKNMPDTDFVSYPTVLECLDAVRIGAVGMTYLSGYEADYYLAQPKYRPLLFRNMRIATQKFSIAVSRDANPLLFPIISKTLHSIPPNFAENLVRQYTTRGQSDSLADLVYTNPVQILAVAIFVILLLCSVIVFSYLYHSNKTKNALLVRAINVKSDFLSRMSHEMRTPLNAIIGIAAIGEEEIQDSKAQQYLGKIRSSGDYLLQLINDVLDMSKIESHKMVLHPALVSLEDFYAGVETMIRPLLDAKDIDYHHIHKNYMEPYAVFDAVRLQQIVLNILSNAIKFSPEGGRIDFIVERISADSSTYHDRIIVRDHGIGMSESFMARAFKAFEQGENTPSQGTGLGLAISHYLAEQMHGSITLKSELGKGTEVTVDVCLDVADPLAVQQHISAAGALQPADDWDAQGAVVLLAEDHPINTEIAKKMLERKHITVEHAANGQEAVQMFSASPAGYYTLVLMDIQMPVMNGLEAARQIRHLAREDANVPIFAMTANAFEDDRQKSREAGMNGHLSKPITPSVLYAELKKYLYKKPDQRK